MIREIVKDTFFLSQKSELATRQDLPVGFLLYVTE